MTDASFLIILIVTIAVTIGVVVIKLTHFAGPSPSPNPDPSPSPSSPPPSGPKVIGLQELQDMWRGNGLLNTSLALEQACKGYNDSQTCVNPAQCNVPDVSDYTALNQIIAPAGGMISCFSLATSLQKKGLAQIVFGPTMNSPSTSGDMTVGLFLDLSALTPYIACMAPIDAASVARYSKFLHRHDPYAVTAKDLTSNYQGLLDDCAQNGNCGLFGAGCAGSGGAGLGTKGYNFASSPYDVPTYKPPNEPARVAMGWSFTYPNSMKLFDRNSMDAYVQTTRQAQQIIGSQYNQAEQEGNQCEGTETFDGGLPIDKSTTCADYWSYQVPGGNGYRNNEIDIFVPQEQEDASKACSPVQDFVDVFRNAVIGVYATPFCAKSIKLTSRGANECCNVEFSKSIAKALADKYNRNPKVKQRINAYLWHCDSPESSWSPDSHDSLQIELIQ